MMYAAAVFNMRTVFFSGPNVIHFVAGPSKTSCPTQRMPGPSHCAAAEGRLSPCLSYISFTLCIPFV